MKSRTTLNLDCDNYDILLSDNEILSQVEAVERKLKIESFAQINDTLTNEELKTAGEMFLYLNSCPNSAWFKSWSSFYKDLLRTQSADQIILTLNRMMKTETSQDKDGKLRAEKLLKRASSLMSLNYERIQSLQRIENSGNGSTIKDSLIQNGTQSSNIKYFIRFMFSTFPRFIRLHHQPSRSYYDP